GGSGRGRIAVDQVGLLDEAGEKLAQLGGLEAGGGVGGADGEQDALLRECAPVGLAQRQRRIEGVHRLAADAVDLEDREVLAAPQLVHRFEPQIEPPVVEFGHAFGDRNQLLLECGRDRVTGIAIECAGAAAAVERETPDLAARRYAIERSAVAAEMARIEPEMGAGAPTRAPIARDQLAQRRGPVTDRVREISERQSENASARARDPRIE